MIRPTTYARRLRDQSTANTDHRTFDGSRIPVSDRGVSPLPYAAGEAYRLFNHYTIVGRPLKALASLRAYRRQEKHDKARQTTRELRFRPIRERA